MVLKLDLDRVYRVLDISSCSIQVMKVPEATESAPSSGMAEETAAETSTGAGETNDASGAQDGTEVSEQPPPMRRRRAAAQRSIRRRNPLLRRKTGKDTASYEKWSIVTIW